MYNIIKLMIMFFSIFSSLQVYALKFNLSPFRFNRYVFYEILYKIEGIKPLEFNNVTIIEETQLKLVFEYAGKQYTAHNLTKGAIKVEMPDGMLDRYLTRNSVPEIILSQYQH